MRNETGWGGAPISPIQSGDKKTDMNILIERMMKAIAKGYF